MKLPKFVKCIVFLVLLLVVEWLIISYLAYWREGFWNAVQQKDLHEFLIRILTFSCVALLSCLVSGYSQYLINYSSLIWRRKITQRCFKVLKSIDHVEGYQQRVQSDCFDYPYYVVALCSGFFKSILTLTTFIVIIILQLGAVYLLIPVIYVLVGMFLASKLAKPLIDLNYINQKLEALFRQRLLKMDYARVHKNNIHLFKKTKYLSYFQSFYNQITVIIPYLIIYPLYFSSKIMFGTFMQCATALNEIISNLSYIINSYQDINKYLSCRKRLKELGVI